MGRILAIDYGTKRCGIATTDDLRLIASGLTTVETSRLYNFLETYCKENLVSCIVLGKPIQNSGILCPIESDILNCINTLKKHFKHIHFDRQDERFTSKIAFDSMISGGIKKKQRQNKALIDEISATLILQSYLSSKNK